MQISVEKKKKKLIEDAAKCTKLTDLFCRGGSSQARDDTGPSSSTATAGKQALSAVTRRYHDLRLETRVVTRTDTTGNLNVHEPGSAPAAWCGHSHS